MEFEWDENKNQTNLIKHQIGFEFASQFLWDEAIIEQDSRKDYGEERFIARGPASDGRCYHIAFTIRADRIRLITMRPFSRRDYRRYGQ